MNEPEEKEQAQPLILQGGVLTIDLDKMADKLYNEWAVEAYGLRNSKREPKVAPFQYLPLIQQEAWRVAAKAGADFVFDLLAQASVLHEAPQDPDMQGGE